MELSAFEAFNLGIIVLFLGRFLNLRVAFLREFNIPEPVTGGILVSVGFTVLYFATGIETSFDLRARDILLIYFFTGIGLKSDIATLIKGGRPLALLLGATLVYMVLQNGVGVTVASITGLSPVVGVIGGTASLIGGHGTTIAWAPIFASQYGITNALEIGIACATFGLILAALMGGPIAKFLIARYKLEPAVIEQPDFGDSYQQKVKTADIDYYSVLYSWLVLNIAIGLGLSLNETLEYAGVKLPDFLTCLFMGIVITNTVPRLFKKLPWAEHEPSLGLISDIALGVFLSMSLMSMQLWALIDLAIPVLSIIAVQFAVAVLYTLFVIFNLMGRDYEAAVVCSGFGGISLGATPTAIANMTAVTKRFGAAHRAFIIVPLVGAFFIDIANAFIINRFLGIFG
ncbi:MAG: sodium/glutamate symporter [Alphaproteobacteria bacterium]|nr:sodium/glutamate symporter [Alphaproteobacteria bacterium]